ncbi:ribonuclease H-like domain-containing protein [Tanacetum coccineum]
MSVYNFEHNSPINSDQDDDVHDPITRISKLDISDPLHLHLNDTTALIVVLIKLKETKNYQVWSCAMLLALEGKNKIGFIDGSCKRSNTDEVLGKQWDRTLPDVRSAYATISSEESHIVAVGSIAESEGSGLVCENCGFNGHTIDRCFKIIGYPVDFGKKKFGSQNQKNKGVSNNNSVGTSSSSVFSDEQMATLLSLIKDNKIGKNVQTNMAGANQHMTYTDKDLDNVLDISYFKIKVGHPNGTKAFIWKSQDLNLKNVLGTGDQCEGLYYYNDQGSFFCAKILKLKNDPANVLQDVNHINFFDIEYLEISTDDERVANDLNKGKSDSSSFCVSGSNINTADFLVDSRNDADSSDVLAATQNEEVAILEENSFSEGNLDQNPSSSQGVQNVRRSSRQSVFPRNYNDFVFSHWTDDMNQEIDALLKNDTWELVDLPEGRKTIGSKWIYKIKFRSSGEIDRYKARLVAQGFGQKEGIDYEETFSPVVKMSDKGVFLALLVYVDAIIITGNSVSEIEKFKVFLKSKYKIKDLGKLKYFLGIEVVDTDKGICLNQRKYVLDLLSEYGMLACKPAKTPLMSKLVISNKASDKDPLLENITDYQKLMGKLIYLTNTRRDISYDVHCLSQFMHSPLTSHLKIAFKILIYLKSCPGLGIHITKTSSMFLTTYSDADWAKCIVTRKSVTGYCVFLNNSLVSWKNFENLLPVLLHCDKNSAIKIAANPVFHERIKHLEIDLHFVREKVLKGVVKTVKVDSANQIADILTKGMDTVQHLELVKRLGALLVESMVIIKLTVYDLVALERRNTQKREKGRRNEEVSPRSVAGRLTGVVIEFEVEEGVREVEEELTPPKVTSWIDPIDGKTMHEVMVITNDLNHPNKKRKYIRCQFDDCTICYQPWTSFGDHQICCLLCGHIYGLSCIKNWLLQSSSCRKACPHCKTICSLKDVKLLYVPRLCTAAHQKADAKKLQSYALKQLTDIKRQHLKVTTHTELLSKWAAEWAQDDAHARLAIAYANELGSRGRRVHVVARLARACELEANKLAQLADALRRWADSLERAKRVPDDAVFIGEWSRGNLTGIMHTLRCFSLLSGLSINLKKSQLLGVGIPESQVLEAATLIGCSVLHTPFKYLGIMVGENMSSIRAWDETFNKSVHHKTFTSCLFYLRRKSHKVLCSLVGP